MAEWKLVRFLVNFNGEKESYYRAYLFKYTQKHFRSYNYSCKCSETKKIVLKNDT